MDQRIAVELRQTITQRDRLDPYKGRGGPTTAVIWGGASRTYVMVLTREYNARGRGCGVRGMLLCAGRVLGEDDGGRAARARRMAVRVDSAIGYRDRGHSGSDDVSHPILGIGAELVPATNGLCSHHRTHHRRIVPRPLASGAGATWRPGHRRDPPRTDFTATKDAGVVQYYENVALVYLPDEAPGEPGAAARPRSTGAGRSQVGGRLARAGSRTGAVGVRAGNGRRCVNVVASGHTVRGPFLDRWQTGETATWLGAPLTESFIAPDGTRVQYFENGILRQTATGEVEPLPLGSIAAKRAKLDVEPIEQPQDVPVYDEELFIPPPDATPVDEGALRTGHSDPDRSRAPGKKSSSPSRLRRCGPTRKASW